MTEESQNEFSLLTRFQGLTFRSFRAWDQSENSPFGEVTLIYGANGSGKSTLATSLLEADREGTEINGNLLDEASVAIDLAAESLPFPVRVFDADHVRDSIEQFTDGTADPVWALGHEDVQLKARIEAAESALGNADELIQEALDQFRDAKKELKEVTDVILTRVRRLADLTGLPSYAKDYSACQAATALKLLREATRSAQPLGDVELDSLLSRTRSVGYRQVDDTSGDLSQLRAIIDSTDTTPLTQGPTPADLEGVADQVLQWVQEGLTHHPSEGQCYFCGEEFTSARLSSLGQLFTRDVENRQADLQKAADKAREVARKIELVATGVKQLDRAQPGARELEESLPAAAAVVGKLTSLAGAYDAFAENPFRLPDSFSELNVPQNDGLDRVRSAQRLAQQNAVQARERAVSEYLSEIASGWLSKYEGARASVDKADETRQERESDQTDARVELQRLLNVEEQGSRDGSRHATELSGDLHDYLGRDDFVVRFSSEFVPGRHGYQLFRGDSVASDLSEGEKTALSLMYFLRALEDKDMELNTCLVWLDDPVTSMDGGATVMAANFIRDKLFDGGRLRPRQLVITTHDFRFFQAMEEALPKAFSKSSGRLSRLLAKRHHPRLEPISSSEVMRRDLRLFRDVMQAAKSGDHERQRGSINDARRLLEYQAHWLYPTASFSEAVRTMVSDAGLSRARFATILKTLHLSSHAPDVEFDYIEEPTNIRPVEVLAGTLRLLKSVDGRHFEAWRTGAGVAVDDARDALSADLLMMANEDILSLGGASPQRVKLDAALLGTCVIHGWQRSSLANSPTELDESAIAHLEGRGWDAEICGAAVHLRRRKWPPEVT